MVCRQLKSTEHIFRHCEEDSCSFYLEGKIKQGKLAAIHPSSMQGNSWLSPMLVSRGATRATDSNGSAPAGKATLCSYGAMIITGILISELHNANSYSQL